jgi:hypothetical protein
MTSEFTTPAMRKEYILSSVTNLIEVKGNTYSTPHSVTMTVKNVGKTKTKE